MKKKNLFVGLLLASAGTVEIVVGDTSKCFFINFYLFSNFLYFLSIYMNTFICNSEWR